LLASLLILAASALLIRMSQGPASTVLIPLTLSGFGPIFGWLSPEAMFLEYEAIPLSTAWSRLARRARKQSPLIIHNERDQARLKGNPPAVHKEATEGLCFLTRVLWLHYRGYDRNVSGEQALSQRAVQPDGNLDPNSVIRAVGEIYSPGVSNQNFQDFIRDSFARHVVGCKSFRIDPNAFDESDEIASGFSACIPFSGSPGMGCIDRIRRRSPHAGCFDEPVGPVDPAMLEHLDEILSGSRLRSRCRKNSQDDGQVKKGFSPKLIFFCR
jgi:hypothetical protein